jgi:hypothetical protein
VGDATGRYHDGKPDGGNSEEHPIVFFVVRCASFISGTRPIER